MNPARPSRALIRLWRENGSYLLARFLYDELSRRVKGLLLQRTLGARVSVGRHARIWGGRHMEIGRNFRAGNFLWLEAVMAHNGQSYSPRIIIKENVTVSDFVHIAATNHVEIGAGVLMGSKVLISDHSHGQYQGEGQSSPATAPMARSLTACGTVVVGDNVWLGDSVHLLPGANIGNGAVIGANSIVSGVIPPRAIAVGAPAVVVKRFDEKEQQWVRVTP